MRFARFTQACVVSRINEDFPPPALAARRINNSAIFPKIYGERFVKRPPLS
jgi:hypothetical protein